MFRGQAGKAVPAEEQDTVAAHRLNSANDVSQCGRQKTAVTGIECRRWTAQLLTICFALVSLAMGGCATADPLTDALDQALVLDIRQAVAAGNITYVHDLTEAAEEFILIGTPLTKAVQVLESSGFDVVRAGQAVVPDGMDARYVGTKRSSVYNEGIFGHYLYAIVLEIKDNVVFDVWADARYQSL